MTVTRISPSLTQKQINEFFLCTTNKQDMLPFEVERIIVCHTLLEHVAYGRLTEAEEMIAYDPSLLLSQYASNVVTPSGLQIKSITPYECALSGGDVGMARMMQPYFDRLINGEKDQKAQYEKYRPYIENIMTQKPYDLQKLVDVLKRSSAEDVQAELNRHTNYERYKDYKSDLREELEQFRKAFTPGAINCPQMQFNYMSLQHAYDTYASQVWPLDNEKCRLFCRQVIGFEQRSLSGRDRQIYAGSLYDYASCEEKAPRAFECAQYKGDSFPVTCGGVSQSGLGFDFHIDIDGEKVAGADAEGGWTSLFLRCVIGSLQNLCRAKATNLQNLCGHTCGQNLSV
jgi:hypothetical protein